MAVPTNTLTSYGTAGKGLREDLSDQVWLVQPADRPFLASIKRETAASRVKDWMTDQPATVDNTDAAVEGDDVVADTLPAAVPASNFTQIFDRTVSISDTQQAIASRGGTVSQIGSMAREVRKQSIALMNSVESRALSNLPKVAGSAGVARKMAGALCFVKTNVSLGAGGASPTGDGTDAPTDGTQRAFTEAQILDVSQGIWNLGGDPKWAIMGAFQKRVFSTFQGVALKEQNTNLNTTTAKAEIFLSDFGMTTARLSRYMRSRSVMIYDPEYFSLAELQPYKDEPLAKTGHSDKRMLTWEGTLIVGNEAMGGAIHDLTTS